MMYKVLGRPKQKHLANWTRFIRELKPDDVVELALVPIAEYDFVTVAAGIAAGWVVDENDEVLPGFNNVKQARHLAGELDFSECRKLSQTLWTLYKEVTDLDPKS